MVHINEQTCKPCGVCGRVCPRRIIEMVAVDGREKPVVTGARVDLCLECGHCAAVCPTGSISVDNLDSAAFREVAPVAVDEDSLLTMLRQRRSVRRYRDQTVPREVLDRIVAAVHAAPTGTGSVSNGVIIVDRRADIETMMEHTYALYEKLDRALENPIARFFVKRTRGHRTVDMLESFVMPGMRWYIRWRKEGSGDEISRDCPALMLFYGPADEPMVEANCTLAAFHAVLMAETLGVGTCFNHLISAACNRSPKLRDLLSLTENEEVHSAVTMGYPAIKFLRTIPHRAKEARYLSPAADDGRHHAGGAKTS